MRVSQTEDLCHPTHAMGHDCHVTMASDAERRSQSDVVPDFRLQVILFDCYNIADCRPLATDNPAEIERIQTARAARLSTLWDPETGRRRSNGNGSPEVGDPAIVGVARPADLNDPNLTKWLKDPNNPISIANARGAYAGPSTMWPVGGSGGAVDMIMGYGHHTGLFTSTDPTFHNWSVKNSDFFVTNSGPSEFFEIPASAAQAGGRIGADEKPTRKRPPPREGCASVNKGEERHDRKGGDEYAH